VGISLKKLISLKELGGGQHVKVFKSVLTKNVLGRIVEEHVLRVQLVL